MFGLKAPMKDGSGEEAPAKTPTEFLTNSWTVAEELNRRCNRVHQHAGLTPMSDAKLCAQE